MIPAFRLQEVIAGAGLVCGTLRSRVLRLAVAEVRA